VEGFKYHQRSVGGCRRWNGVTWHAWERIFLILNGESYKGQTFICLDDHDSIFGNDVDDYNHWKWWWRSLEMMLMMIIIGNDVDDDDHWKWCWWW
jgi:hypothetical protein